MKRIYTIIAVLFLLQIFQLSAQTPERTLFQEAEGRFRTRDYEFALERYDELLREYPLSGYIPDIQFRRAVCMYRLGRINDSLGLFLKMESRYSSTRFRNFIPFWLGVIYYDKLEYETAVTYLKEFLTHNEESLKSEALLYKGLSENSLGYYEDAAVTIRGLIDGSPDPESEPYALTLLCSLLIKKKDYNAVFNLVEGIDLGKLDDKWKERLVLYKAEALWDRDEKIGAESLYLQLLESPPDISSIAFQRLFSIYQESDDEEKLSSILHTAENSLTGLPGILKDFWLRVGISSYQQKKYQLALSYFQRIWSLGETADLNELVPLYLAEILNISGEIEKSIDTILVYFDKSGNRTEHLLFKLSGFYIEKGEWAAAAAVYTEFLAGFPDSGYYSESAYLNAYALFKTGAYESSLDQIEQIFENVKGGVYIGKLLRLKSQLYKKLGDLPAAIAALKEYMPLNTDDIQARVDLLKLYFSIGDYKRIITETGPLFSGIPDFETSYPSYFLLLKYMTGLSYISESDYENAVAMLSSISREAVDSTSLGLIYPYTLFYKGWAYYRTADYIPAGNAFKELIETFPDHELTVRAYYLAGWCAYTGRDYPGAEIYFGAYSHAAPPEEVEKGKFMYGKALLGQKKYNEAALIFQNISIETSESPFADDAVFEFAGILIVLDEIEEAVDQYFKLYDNYKHSPLAEESLFKRGEILYEKENYIESVEAFYLHRRRFPAGTLTDASLFWGGMASYNTGEEFGAVLLWEKLINEFRESPFRSDAILRTAEIYADTGDFRKALVLYTEMLTVYPGEASAVSVDEKIEKLTFILLGQSDREAELSVIIGREGAAATKAGREALIELSRIYLYKGDAKQDLALTMLQSVVEKKGEDISSAAGAQYLIGEYYFRKDDIAKAGQEFIAAAALNPDDKDLMAMSMYRAAEMAKLSGNISEAGRMVNRIEINFPQSQWAAEGRKLMEGAE